MDESQSGGESSRAAAQGAGGPPAAGPRRPAARAVRTVRGARGWSEWREWTGWIIAAAGAALCVLGWYGVSGEQFAEQQIPYLASSTIPGAALIVAGVVLVALRSSGRSPGPSDRSADLTHRRVERLYALLVEPDDGPDDGPGDGSPGDNSPSDDADGTGNAGNAGNAETAGVTLAVPEGTLYHRPHCPLVTGKPRAVPVDAAAVRARGLAPCRLCEPGPPGGADPPEGPADPPEGPAGPGDAAPPAG